VQDLAQVAAQYFQVAAEERRGQRDRGAPGSVQQALAGHVRLVRAQGVDQVHLAEQVQMDRAAKLDGLAARPQRGRALHDGRLETVLEQPECQGGTGDARTGDQHVLGHAATFARPADQPPTVG
jgi:hypothetical protein